MVYKYDEDADILSIEISKQPIEHAQEMGDLIVHFTQNDKPVLLEILNAKKFLKKTTKILPLQTQKRIFSVT